MCMFHASVSDWSLSLLATLRIYVNRHAGMSNCEDFGLPLYAFAHPMFFVDSTLLASWINGKLISHHVG